MQLRTYLRLYHALHQGGMPAKRALARIHETYRLDTETLAALKAAVGVAS